MNSSACRLSSEASICSVLTTEYSDPAPLYRLYEPAEISVSRAENRMIDIRRHVKHVDRNFYIHVAFHDLSAGLIVKDFAGLVTTV